MLRSPRRLLLAPLALVLALGLVSCGNSDSDGSSDSSSSSALDAVKITGDVGKAPTVKFDSVLKAGAIKTTTLTEGDGEKVAEGDQVLTNVWIGNGTTKAKAYSTYDQGQAQAITVDDNLSPVFKDALLGQTIGSRVAVTASAEEAFGSTGNTQLGIGNKDSIVVIVDLEKLNIVLDGPNGTKQKSPAWAPSLVQKGGKVSALDFTGTPAPDNKLRAGVLYQGTGAKVASGQSITVNYLGQVYQAKAPFDESYTKTPATFAIGAGAVIPGWDKTLVGQTVGSRVILAIPPSEGYGKKGQPQAGIKGTDTLYFVVDILAAG